MPSVRSVFKSRRRLNESPEEEMMSNNPVKQHKQRTSPSTPPPATPPDTPPLSPDPEGSFASDMVDEHDLSTAYRRNTSNSRRSQRSQRSIDPDGITQNDSGEMRDQPQPTQPTPPNAPKVTFQSQPPKSAFSFLKRGKNATVRTGSGIPVITSSGADDFSPSLVNASNSMGGLYHRKEGERPRVRPSAKTAAFAGPVRYDWMDIETAAAIKVQAAYRRMLVLKHLEEQGLSTASIRNRRRRRNAQKRMLQSEDVPFPFSLCGVGFLFGDGTLEDERVTKAMEHKKVEKKKMEAEMEEENKRKFRMRRKESKHLEEGIEVVESFEGEEDDEGGEEGEGGVQEKEELPPLPPAEEEKSPRWRRSLGISRRKN